MLPRETAAGSKSRGSEGKEQRKQSKELHLVVMCVCGWDDEVVVF